VVVVVGVVVVVVVTHIFEVLGRTIRLILRVRKVLAPCGTEIFECFLGVEGTSPLFNAVRG